jgi:pimeloyl-ACP methyl ester carboxylesterase
VHTADPDPAPDPVVYFSGGPGFPGLTDAAGFLRRAQTGNRNVILFDQRGTGRSEPSLDCPEVHDATSTILGAAESFDAESKLLSDALFKCRDRLRDSGVDLSQYNTESVAEDVADLRTAMGTASWNLFGVSYGTTVALATMRQHPEGVRSVVVDSVVPTDVGVGAPETVAAYERVKRVLFDGCANDPACHAAFPNLESDTTDAIAAMNASPYQGTITNPVLQRSTPITITGADAAAGLFNALYDSNIIPQVPNLIEQLKNGTVGPIIDQVAVQAIEQINGTAEAQTAAVDCHDRGSFVHPDDDQRALQEHPDASTLLLFTSVSCESFGVTPANDGFNEPVRSDIPTLVFADEYDPVTPPEQSKHAAETLSHSTYVEFPGLGHGAVFSGRQCPVGLFRSFLADPVAPLDTRCVSVMGEPKWAVPGG